MKNEAEAVAYWICRKSFLSLWSYANPQGRTHKAELCDVLIVCDPDIIIVSVKDVQMKELPDREVQMARWYRRAILESAEQVYGAERWINVGNHSHVITSDGDPGLPYPNPKARRIHRIVIALGAHDDVPILFGDFGRGFVHVFDGQMFEKVLEVLDTITDFVAYLNAKEELLLSVGKSVVCPNELDLLATYLRGGCSFTEANGSPVQPDTWERFHASLEYEAKLNADQESYFWDGLIEMVASDIKRGTLEAGGTLSESEQVLRTLAREPRFARRVLSIRLREFLQNAATGHSASRMVQSTSPGVGYVFLARDDKVPKVQRGQELAVRCAIARGTLPDVTVVVGLATETPGSANHISWVLHYFSPSEWTKEDDEFVARLKTESGFFSKVEQKVLRDSEYPPTQ